MPKPEKKIYWLVLMTATVFFLCALMPGGSYGSMVSSDTWQTQLQTSAITVTGDYLTQGGQRVLLAPLTEERTVRFSLKADRLQMNGNLAYTVSPTNAVTVHGGKTLTATQAGAAGELVLTPGAVSQETAVTVTVRWTGENGQVLQADFLTTVAPGTTPEQPQQTQPQGGATMTVGAETAIGAATPVNVTYPAGTEQLVLSLEGGAAFPAGTGYRTDYNEERTVLYDPAQIRLPASGKEKMVLLTLPDSMVAAGQPITLQTQVITQTGSAVLTGQTKPVAASLQLQGNEFHVLSAGQSCVLNLPAGWSGCSLSYTVSQFTQTQNGFVYQTVVNSDSKGLSVTGDANGIVIRVTGNGLQAGTYRLTLVWSYQTYTIAQRNVTFYVGYPDTGITGGNAQ